MITIVFVQGFLTGFGEGEKMIGRVILLVILICVAGEGLVRWKRSGEAEGLFSSGFCCGVVFLELLGLLVSL